MGFFHDFFNKRGRYRLIPDRRTGADYMHRYYLLFRDRKQFPFNITLHKIVRSDDPVMHDHPWPYLTIVLKGGYWEHTPLITKNGRHIGDTSKWRGPGSIILRKAKELHWLELDNDNPATTLFFMGPQQREWGFLVKDNRGRDKWIKWTEFLKKS
jgi:hypothetical protein